jgi:hypothetical protein
VPSSTGAGVLEPMTGSAISPGPRLVIIRPVAVVLCLAARPTGATVRKRQS